MTVKFKMKRVNIPNDTVLLFGISYRRDEPGGDTRGRTNPKVFTYAGLKTGGLWYFSGSGKAPQAAGWPAVERWLERDGREVEWVKLAGEAKQIWPDFVDAEESPAEIETVAGRPAPVPLAQKWTDPPCRCRSAGELCLRHDR